MIQIITWNIGGAKYLELPEHNVGGISRQDFSLELNKALKKLCEDYKPDFVVLQEVVKYGDDPLHSHDLLKKVPGYHYDASIAIDTVNQSHPNKWEKYFEKGDWESGSYLAQGYGILWREDIKHASIWDFTPVEGAKIEKEIVHLDTGVFTGDRDTEPRLAVVTHFIIQINNRPQDIFIVNLHLATLKGERGGSPNKDNTASKIRQGQIDVVMNGIVSRYNEWSVENLQKQGLVRPPAVWIFAGDFNCMPNSPEISNIQRMNFIDLNPNKGSGTKGKGVPIRRATITLDYIFAGPAYYALDPYFVKKEIERNPTPLTQFQVSDHFPVFAEVPIVENKA
jgi:endonuclease/exonuclease/phosphatase family metal-dependent hydrolase